MRARNTHKVRKSIHEAPSLNPRLIFVLFLVVTCSVFLWTYYNANVSSANASSPEEERTVITRPVDNSQ